MAELPGEEPHDVNSREQVKIKSNVPFVSSHCKFFLKNSAILSKGIISVLSYKSVCTAPGIIISSLLSPFKSLKNIFAEIAGMGFFPMYQKDRALYLLAILKDRRVEEGQRGSYVPAVG